MSDNRGEGMDDELFVDFMGPSDAETRMPPPMYAVPAATMGILGRGQLVTVGVPGSHWIIDENIVIDGPEPGPDGEVQPDLPRGVGSGHVAPARATQRW